MNAMEDVRYRQSTQFRLWSHTRSELATLRSKTNTLATTHISNRLSSSQDGQTQVPPFLTADEEARLLRFYTVELLRAGEFCNMPTEVRATAAVYLRRFYVTNSVMTYSPTEITKTCLFFGSKSEGYYKTLSKFAGMFPNTTAEEVLAGEFLLCQGVRFCFDVRHPFRALEGAILELRRLYPEDRQRVDHAHAKARNILKFSSLITDAYFHFTPSQIMHAALSMADHDLGRRILDASFRLAVGHVPEDKKDIMKQLEEKILSTIESCREMLETEPPERMEEYWGTPECNKEIKPLLRKLRKCRDPDRADLVALQRVRREQANRKERPRATEEGDDVFGAAGQGQGAGEREAKRRKVSSAVADPFGPALG